MTFITEAQSLPQPTQNRHLLPQSCQRKTTDVRKSEATGLPHDNTRAGGIGRLESEGFRPVAMESTNVCWIPVYALLEALTRGGAGQRPAERLPSREDARMPELPDIVVYIESLESRLAGQELGGVRIASPLLLRTVDPPLEACLGKRVVRFQRLGKRIAIGLEEDYWLVLHLMIAGRLHWRAPGARLPGKRGLAAFDFPNGTLVLTEAGSRKRASLHVAQGEQALEALHRGGLEVLEATLADFQQAIRCRNRTLKRALTDPGVCSGIGNAYSDEILHRARLSPVALTGKLEQSQVERLFVATREVLEEWVERLRAQAVDKFPEKVTAFRDGMAVHGRYGKPCPDCGAPVQRIRYASNETNYCARCQTGGRVLADRSLSRLLRSDWPRSLEELSNG